MSRGSEIVIGLFAALVAGVLCLIAFSAGDDSPVGFFPQFVMSLFFACVAAACFFETGRWLTTRITTAGIAGVMVIGIVIGLSSDDTIPSKLGQTALVLALSGTCGYYAVTGRYPDDMPMSDFFAQPSNRSKKKSKKKRKKKSTRRRRNYDYE